MSHYDGEPGFCSETCTGPHRDDRPRGFVCWVCGGTQACCVTVCAVDRDDDPTNYYSAYDDHCESDVVGNL